MRYIKRENKYLACPYEHYYLHQAGSGIGTVYKGAVHQRGRGIGSFLGGLFRNVIPLLKSGTKVIGKEALSTGVGIINDMFHAKPFEESLKDRLQEATQNLKRKADEKIKNINMSGSGYKRKKTKRNRSVLQSSSRLKQRVKNKINKNTKAVNDIFA